MMTAKARGKNQVVYFDESANERPQAGERSYEDVRSIAHLKMLQSLAGSSTARTTSTSSEWRSRTSYGS